MSDIDKPTIVLCVLDGFDPPLPGVSDSALNQYNAAYLANTPNWDKTLQDHPWAPMITHGKSVGLEGGEKRDPDNNGAQPGNSDVGHKNIGAGRIVEQMQPTFNNAIKDGSYANSEALQKIIADLKQNNGTFHLSGVTSDGGVHAHIDHIIETARIVSQAGVPVEIHAILDGRDTPPNSSVKGDPGFILQLQDAIADIPNTQIASVTGRANIMDRANNWAVMEDAYHAMVDANATKTDNFIQAVINTGKADEFVPPIVRKNYAGMKDGDAFFTVNYRADRTVQPLTMFADPDFEQIEKAFTRPRVVNFSNIGGVRNYSEKVDALMTVAPPFTEQVVTNTLCEVISNAGLTQLHISGQQKANHVGKFIRFKEDLMEGETLVIFDSPEPKENPAMTTQPVTDRVVQAIQNDEFDVIIINYECPDMVGHTGYMDLAMQAVEAVDSAIGDINEAVIKNGGAVLYVADHGNIGLMKDPITGEKHTAHTSNLVPMVAVGKGLQLQKDATGILADVAPTLIAIIKQIRPDINIDKPVEMTGISMLVNQRLVGIRD